MNLSYDVAEIFVISAFIARLVYHRSSIVEMENDNQCYTREKYF